MKSIRKKLLLLVLSILVSLVVGLMIAQSAWALAEYAIADDATGGQCGLIGTWNATNKTCTLNRDISVSGAIDGIEINSDNVTLDGAGHSITLTGTLGSQDGVYVLNRNGSDVTNLTIKGFARGIVLNGSTGCSIFANWVELNAYGIAEFGSDVNQIAYNTFKNNTIRGLWLSSSDSNSVSYNNFLANVIQAYVSVGSINNNFMNNYWDNFDTRPEGCVNTTPFSFTCDGAYVFTGGSDGGPVVLRDIWGRYDWTWYDNVGSDNWVLLANRPDNLSNMLFNLSINNTMQPLASVPGYSPGYVPPGSAIYNKYEGLMGGPVTATNMNFFERAITSQRILWPKGGNSLEEVTGGDLDALDSRLYWTWYDMVSPGYKNWVLISNPNDYQINYNIKIGGAVVDTGTIPANGRVTPLFPGVIGGPVEANAWNSFSDPVHIMGSQRVLSNGDMAFNEQPGQAAGWLSDYYVWTWYDQASAGAQNWVLVANPPGAVGPIYYEVWIGGTKLKDGGPIAPGGNETPTFPGTIGGPVEVKSFSDAAHTLAANSIASQRIIWGPSFGEVLGRDNAALGSSHYWTWYDELSPGARNWVLVANPPGGAPQMYYEVWIAGVKVHDGGPISPGGNETPTFPGSMGGPVEVRSFSDAAHTVTTSSIASQRVLWNGYFNELWGQ